MYRFLLQTLIAPIVFASLGMAAPPVEIVTAAGSFTLDGSKVTGNATLFEGSRIETETVSARLQLSGGGRMQLAPESKGVVSVDRLVLERGSVRFELFSVEALSLRIQSDDGFAAAEVSVLAPSIAGPGTVRVAAFYGSVRVATAKGVVLANLLPGRSLNFIPPELELAAVPSAPAAPAAAGIGAGGKIAIATVVAAGAATGAAVAVVKASDEPAAISPSTR